MRCHAALLGDRGRCTLKAVPGERYCARCWRRLKPVTQILYPRPVDPVRYEDGKVWSGGYGYRGPWPKWYDGW